MATRLEGHRPPLSGCSNLYRMVLYRFKTPGLNVEGPLQRQSGKRRCARYLPATPHANGAANLTGDSRIDGPHPNRPAPYSRADCTAHSATGRAASHAADD